MCTMRRLVRAAETALLAQLGELVFYAQFVAFQLMYQDVIGKGTVVFLFDLGFEFGVLRL